MERSECLAVRIITINKKFKKRIVWLVGGFHSNSAVHSKITKCLQGSWYDIQQILEYSDVVIDELLIMERVPDDLNIKMACDRRLHISKWCGVNLTFHQKIVSSIHHLISPKLLIVACFHGQMFHRYQLDHFARRFVVYTLWVWNPKTIVLTNTYALYCQMSLYIDLMSQN